MQAEVSFSPSPAFWVIVGVIVLWFFARWLWIRRSRRSGSAARPPTFSLFGDVTESVLPTGWSDEQIVALFGDVRMDLRNRPPADGATLRVFHLVGDVELRVSSGTRVVTGGTTLFGDQRVEVGHGEGLEFEVRAWGLVGDVHVTE